MGPRGIAVVDERGKRKGRCLAQAHIARDDRLIDKPTEIFAGISLDLLRQVVAAVVHRQHDTGNAQVLVGGLPYFADREHELRQPLQRKEFALQGHDNRVGRHHRVDGQNIQRGRAIDQDVVKPKRIHRQLPQGVVQQKRPLLIRNELDVGGAEIGCRGDNRQVRHTRRLDGLLRRGVADEKIIGRHVALFRPDPEARRRVSLGIEVDQQDMLPLLGQGRAKIDRCRRLADTTLLVGNSKNARTGGVTNLHVECP